MSTYPLMVRDMLINKVMTLPFFVGHGFTFTTNKSVQVQPENIPLCGVYMIEETGIPDGDANVAETRFRTSVRYGFSVVVQNNDMVAAENKLDEAMEALSAMFGDPTVYNWKNAGKAGQAAIQSFSRGSRTHQFGAVGLNNETPIAELRFEMTCDLGVLTYPPRVDDDFKHLHIEVHYPKPDDVGVQPVVAVFDILLADTIGTHIPIATYMTCNATVVP